MSFYVLWLPSLPMLERDAWSKESTNGGNQLDKVEESGNKCRSHIRCQMLMHKINEDFGTTESVKFVTFARLLWLLVWISK